MMSTFTTKSSMLPFDRQRSQAESQGMMDEGEAPSPAIVNPLRKRSQQGPSLWLFRSLSIKYPHLTGTTPDQNIST